MTKRAAHTNRANQKQFHELDVGAQESRQMTMPLKSSFMFKETQPSEVVSAYLLPLHVISIRRIRDANFDKTRDAFLHGTA